MAKISDITYRLPTIEALGAFNQFDKGTTEPLAIWGVDTVTGKRGPYVVKFKNTGRMTVSSSAFELIAAWMAKELDLPVVEPVLVNISSDFVETALIGKDGYRAAFQSQGLNFGSTYLPGYTNLPQTPLILPKESQKTVELIYVFDLFIANTDRGHQRPNVSFNGTDLLLYDHELAFSFLLLLPFMRNQTPWIFNEADKDLYKKHLFYEWLRKQKPDFAEHVQRLRCFDEAFWLKVYQHLPADWKTDKVLEIEPYLSGMIKNLPYFAESLNQTMNA